jgi:hypothetical protein
VIRSSPGRTVVATLLLIPLAGCVTVEATLRSDGSGTLVMTYQTQPDATEFIERRRFTSPHVTVTSVKIYEDQRTVLRATVDDVRQLSTAPGFALVAVTRTREDDDERLVVTLVNPAPVAVKQKTTPWFSLSVTLPGAVRDANHHAVVSGSRVTWSVSRSDYQSRPTTALSVRYRPPSSAGTGAGHEDD